MISLIPRRGRNGLFLLMATGLMAVFWLYSGSDIGDLEAIPAHDSVREDIIHSSGPKRPSTLQHTRLGSASTHGFTFLDKLYMKNGIFYIITSDTARFPERKHMISRPLQMGMEYDMDPTDEDLQFVTPERAKDVLGEHFLTIKGLSVIFHDTPQFMDHYYHWWGELILGFWRVHSVIGSSLGISPSALDMPERFLLPHVSNDGWKDSAGVDGPLMRAGFPSASVQQADYWNDLISLAVPVVFECAAIVSRETAHRHPLTNTWSKMIGSTMGLKAPEYFFEPIRKNTVRNVLGYLPELDDHGVVVSPPHAASRLPIVTYISRQRGGRRALSTSSHESLVTALQELEAGGICEVNIATMEQMNLRQQIEMAAKSTIIVGVHGNGLTHELWMPPSPRSAVMEIFFPQAYIFDYEILARNVGHRHYAVWNDTLVTNGTDYTHPEFGNSDDFHGSSIPVHGPAVAQAIRELLA